MELIEALREFDSATVSNAIEELSIRDRTEGYASMELRCLFPELRPMVGFAVTCTMDTTTPGPRRSDRLHELLDVIVASPGPPVLVIQDVGPDRLKGCFVGDMICGVYRKLGVSGVVTDGGIRDVSGIRKSAPGLHVFAPGVVVSHGNSAIIDINVTVTVGGLHINPGDLLHGDESGIVEVPLGVAAQVVELSRRVREKEAALFEYLQAPSVTLKEMKRHVGRPADA